jgi:hypothetical protein
MFRALAVTVLFVGLEETLSKWLEFAGWIENKGLALYRISVPEIL